MYILFAGECYYATGGANDIQGQYKTLLSAESMGKYLEQDRTSTVEWWHVFCTETMQIVAKSDVTPHGVD